MAGKDERACEAWMALTDLFTGHEHRDRFPGIASELALTPGQLQLLLHLAREGDGRPMRALTSVMRCDASYVTTVVDALEGHGYLERQISLVDRRVKLVFVTATGQAAAARAIALLSVPPAGFQRLSAADLELLLNLLAKAAGRNS